MRQRHTFVITALVIIAAPCLAQADYATTVLEDKPVAYYRFEEPEGADEIADSSGNDHVGFEVNDVEFAREGVAGSLAAEFLGSGSIVVDLIMDPADPEGDGIGVGNDDFTIETWFYTTGVEEDPNNPDEMIVKDQQVYIAQRDGTLGPGRSDMLITVNRQPGSYIGGNTTNAFDPAENDPVAAETWYHFVMTVDGTNQELYYYVNGEPSDLNPQFPGANGIESANGEWIIGSHKSQTSQFFEGLLDEIAFYDYRLDDPNGDDDTSDSRIMAHYQAAFDGGLPGDFDGDGALTADDIDRLTTAVRDGLTDAIFDVSGDGSVDAADREFWVNELKKTYLGDSNLDGEFNSGDMVLVFTSGEYEDGVPMNSTWGTGDWDGDGDFGSGDFVAAFTAGGYEQGPRGAVASVPEPASATLVLVGLLGLVGAYRQK